MPKVFIEQNERAYTQMFINNGWEVVVTPEEADFIQFTGGEDVWPGWYKEEAHPYTGFNKARDENCFRLFDLAQDQGKACLGICRGSQFLTVACGGSLWQHVEGHGLHGTHPLVDLSTGKVVPCSSTHHQMMDSSRIFDRELLAVSGYHYETKKQRGSLGAYYTSDYDEEANWYPRQNSLVFQPHPEFYSKEHPCQVYYFELIARCFGEQV